MWQDRRDILKEIEEEDKKKKKEGDNLAISKKRKKEGLSKKDIIDLIIHKVELTQNIYEFLISVCKENNENQLILFELLPYFQIHAKYIPNAVTFMIELISKNIRLLLSLSENLRIEFDYSQ